MCTENLALHKPAWQSSTWWSGHTGADRAVDGRHTDISVEEGQCAVSPGEHTLEWRVDLGGVKYIHHVFIQHSTGKSMLGIISFKIIDCFIQ